MSNLDRVLELAITVVLIIGGYQFYFWAQRRRWYPARQLETRFDAWVVYNPRWVWVYSGLYYPMILLAAFVQPSWNVFAHVVACYLMLLSVHVVCFVFFPVEIPEWWREVNRGPFIGTRSQNFLDFVWRFDKFRNSMPSMHVSMAVVTDAMIAKENMLLGQLGILFPVLIAASALKTKQHYVVDVVPGALVGAFVVLIWRMIEWS